MHEAAGAQFAFAISGYGGSPIPISRHILGTLRMGDDPARAVTDRFGRFHEVDNLHATDGSVFPTSSGYNPTLSIQALALRAAGAMLDPLRPEAILPE